MDIHPKPNDRNYYDQHALHWKDFEGIKILSVGNLRKNKNYPNLLKSNLFRLGYIASKSSHSRGSTVDITLVDMETGEELRMLPNEFKSQYITRYEKGISALKLKCGDLAVDFVPLAIEDGYNEVLTRYLLKRQSML